MNSASGEDESVYYRGYLFRLMGDGKDDNQFFCLSLVTEILPCSNSVFVGAYVCV